MDLQNTPLQSSHSSRSPKLSSGDTAASLRGLWQLVTTEKRDIVLVLIYGVAVGAFSLVVPIAAQTLVNTVAFNSLIQPIVVLAGIVLFMLGIASVLRVVQTAIVETIQQRVFARIALDLAYRLPRIRIEAYDQSRGTELVNRFFEVLTVQKAAALMLLDGLAIALQSAIGLVLLSFYHPILLAFDVLLVLCMGIVLWMPARSAIATSIAESKAKYKVVAWLEELARNPMVFKLARGSDYALTRADEITSEYLLARENHFRILIRQIAGTLLVQTVVSALLLGLGSILVIKKQLTLGQLVAAEIVVTMVVSGFAKLGKYLESFYDLTASVEKLGQLFALPLERGAGEPIKSTQSPAGFSVKMRNVSFHYGTGRTAALSEIDLEAKPQARIGINGGNGSGKSTLFDLIVGLRFPMSGSVEISGVDLREAQIEEIRKHVALVRKVEIFDGSLLDNIRVGRNEISIEEIRFMLSQVSLLDEISALPDGLLTELTGSLNPLSAGQAQRLMLVRALVGRPKLLLLDEALENVDAEIKGKILNILFDKNAPWTLILATHDSFELSHCDEVLRLQSGQIYGPDESHPTSGSSGGRGHIP